MTDNDNKDPQITPEIEEAVARGIHSAILGAGEFDEWWNNPEDKGAKDFLLGMVRGAITAYESRLSAELKQLRAEQAGLLLWTEEQLVAMCVPDTQWNHGYMAALMDFKSRLTQTQNQTPTEGER